MRAGIVAAAIATIINGESYEAASVLQGEALARDVAAVVRVATGGDWCSGFLVAPDLVMTAAHCLVRCEQMSVEFGHGDPSVPRGAHACVGVEVASATFDYALLRIARTESSEGARPLRLLRAARAIGTDLLLPAHPGGRPKVIDRSDDCRIRPGPNPSTTNVYHGCDTESGSSGAPLLVRATGAVAALHNRGGPDYNIAVGMGAILRDLERQAPTVLAELQIEEAGPP